MGCRFRYAQWPDRRTNLIAQAVFAAYRVFYIIILRGGELQPFAAGTRLCGLKMIPNKLVRENGPYHAILVGCPEEEKQMVPYQLERLVRYRADWLIPGYLRDQAGSAQLCLEITGLKSLDQAFSAEKRSPQLGLELLEAICSCLLAGLDMLLPLAQFSLHPSLVYLDDTGRVRLAFWPFCPTAEDVTATREELHELTRTVADAFNWPEPAGAAAGEAARSGPAALLAYLQQKTVIQTGAVCAQQPDEAHKKSRTASVAARPQGELASETETAVQAKKRVSPALQLLLLPLHLLTAAAVVWYLLGRLDALRPLLIPAAATLAIVDILILLHSHAAVGRLMQSFWYRLIGKGETIDGNNDQQDDQTVLLTTDEPVFRMAMLSEGQPGTPAEHEGLRAFILVEEFIIGRDPKKSDLCLPNASIGRLHARIVRRAGSFFVCDLGSGNGTQLDGKRLPKHEDCLLPDQCLLQFADRPFYFHAD